MKIERSRKCFQLPGVLSLLCKFVLQISNQQNMKNKILFFVSLLFGLVFISSGLNKFFNYMPMPEKMPAGAAELFAHAAAIAWLLPLVATAEIIGGLLVIFPKTRALGAIIVFPVMVGILLTHTFSFLTDW